MGDAISPAYLCADGPLEIFAEACILLDAFWLQILGSHWVSLHVPSLFRKSSSFSFSFDTTEDFAVERR